MSTTLDRTPTAPDAAPPSSRRAVKALLAGGAALALLVGGGTMAALSDFAIVPGNRVGVATLELQLANATAPAPGVRTMAFDDVALLPGDTLRWMQVATVTGQVPSSTLSVRLQGLTGVEDGCNGAEDVVDPGCASGGEGDLLDAATIRVSAVPASATNRCPGGTPDGNPWVVNNLTRSTALSGLGSVTRTPNGQRVDLGAVSLRQAATQGVVPLSTAVPGQASAPYLFTPGEQVCLGMVVEVPSNGTQDNALQGDRASFDLRFDLVQSVQP